MELFTWGLQETQWVTTHFLFLADFSLRSCLCLIHLPSCLTVLCSIPSGSPQRDSSSGGGASAQGSSPGFLCQLWWEWGQVFRRPWGRPLEHRPLAHLQPHALPEGGSQVGAFEQPLVLSLHGGANNSIPGDSYSSIICSVLKWRDTFIPSFSKGWNSVTSSHSLALFWCFGVVLQCLNKAASSWLMTWAWERLCRPSA